MKYYFEQLDVVLARHDDLILATLVGFLAAVALDLLGRLVRRCLRRRSS